MKAPYNQWLNSLSDVELIQFAKKAGVRGLDTNRKNLLSLLTKGSSAFNARGRALFSEEEAEKKAAWGTVCASCGNGPEPHNFRHPFQPLNVGKLGKHDRMKLVDWMCESLEGSGILEDGDLHAANLPGVREAIESWTRHIRQVLLPLIHEGRL